MQEFLKNLKLDAEAAFNKVYSLPIQLENHTRLATVYDAQVSSIQNRARQQADDLSRERTEQEQRDLEMIRGYIRVKPRLAVLTEWMADDAIDAISQQHNKIVTEAQNLSERIFELAGAFNEDVVKKLVAKSIDQLALQISQRYEKRHRAARVALKRQDKILGKKIESVRAAIVENSSVLAECNKQLEARRRETDSSHLQIPPEMGKFIETCLLLSPEMAEFAMSATCRASYNDTWQLAHVPIKNSQDGQDKSRLNIIQFSNTSVTTISLFTLLLLSSLPKESLSQLTWASCRTQKPFSVPQAHLNGRDHCLCLRSLG